MKRVLVLTHEYLPFHGGIAAYCYNLFRYFPRDHYVILTDQPGAAGERVEPVRFLSALVRPRWFRGFITVMARARKNDADIIFTPHILPLGTIAYYVSRMSGVPYIISLHGLDINLALKRRPRLTRAILSRAASIVANSEYTAGIVRKMGLTTPLAVITPAHDPDKLRVDERLKRQVAARHPDKKIILSVGRLVARKGFDTVLLALPEVVKRVPDAYYVMVGSGPEHRALEQMIRNRGLSSCAEIRTDVSDGELAAYYSLAKLFVLPTREENGDVEGYGIVFLEAESFGLPIIAGESGGVREVIRDRVNGTVHRGDEHALAETMVNILNDAGFASRLGAAARRQSALRPTWEDQSKRLADLLS